MNMLMECPWLKLEKSPRPRHYEVSPPNLAIVTRLGDPGLFLKHTDAEF
jgi:hypothetical protein